MRHPSGRILAWSIVLLFGLAAVAVHPAAAGSATVPEIVDDPGDQQLTVEDPAILPLCVPVPLPVPCLDSSKADVVKGWIDNETATSLQFHILVTGDLSADDPTTTTLFNFHISIASTSIEMQATVHDKTATAGAHVSAASIVGANELVLTVLKSELGNPGKGVEAQGIHIETDFGETLPQAGTLPVAESADVAPDGGDSAGVSYTFTGGGSSGGNTTVGKPGDKDGDGLNDTFEKKYFQNETSGQIGSGDPDGDGLNNTQEQKHGTDPTKADTDGDGASDKAEVDAGTNPNDPASKPGGTSPSPTPSATPTPSPSPTNSTSPAPSTSAAATSSDEPCDSSDPGTCFKGSNLGYAAISGTLMLVVIAVCAIALLGRWAV